MSEITRTLRTGDRRKAALLTARLGYRLQRAFDVIRQHELSREGIRQIVRRCFDQLSTEVDDGYSPDPANPELERIEQLAMASDCIRELAGQIELRTFDQRVECVARDALCGTSFQWEDQSVARRLDLLEGTARALIEQQRLFIQRMNDRLLPYQPSDELFGKSCDGPIEPIAKVGPETVPIGPTLKEAIERYLEAGAKRWRPKTYSGRVRMLTYLVEHIGAHRPLATIRASDVRSFRDAVLSLRRNYGRKPDLSFAARQTTSHKHRIAPKTAVLIFEPCKAFFAWCTKDEGYLDTNPAENVRIGTIKVEKIAKSRRSFDEGELRTIFSAPLFTGCKSHCRRFEPGSVRVRDGKFWLPLLGYYTGARLGELVQLEVRDVHLSSGVAHISINEDNAPDTNSKERKHVKSKAGIRCVPLHPALLDLGFAEFVEMRSKKLGKGRVRLFGEFRFGTDGQASTEASKWFGRFLDKTGLTGTDIVFHSFRHGAEDALRNAKQPQYVIDKIIGHSDGAVSSQYGSGVSLKVAHDAICEAIFPVDIRDLWRSV